MMEVQVVGLDPAPAAPAAAAADNAAAATAPPAADAPARRPPLTLVNPFRFLKLLTGTPVMAKLCAASWLAAWTEGKNTTDMLQLWMRNDVGLTPLQAKSECSNGRLGLCLLPTLTFDRCCKQTSRCCMAAR